MEDKVTITVADENGKNVKITLTQKADDKMDIDVKFNPTAKTESKESYLNIAMWIVDKMK